MTVMNWEDMCIKYRGFCVATLEKKPADRITLVAVGKTFEEVEENAKNNGYPDAAVYCVPLEDTLFIGGGYEIPLSQVHFPKEI
jgi:hypothetical protein